MDIRQVAARQYGGSDATATKTWIVRFLVDRGGVVRRLDSGDVCHGWNVPQQRCAFRLACRTLLSVFDDHSLTHGLRAAAIGRGDFQGAAFACVFEGSWTGGAAAILVSLLFALLHYSHMHASFVFSLVMCFLARRRGVGECVVAHASHNLCAVLLDAF
ncbi:CPBP family intramembrane metalloprotease [Pseudoxanthomonas sp. NC8]|nr:CPBP family intramembrane metalloprotease [Pseudoxanthomonas sp. NC8]